MEYLDKEGLRYYNSKIQTQINAKANDGDLSAVAKSGSYNDLTNKPSIPPEITVDSALSTTSTNPVQNNLITNALNSKVSSSNVVDNLTSVGANVPLSAKQGKILNESKLEASNIKAGENIVLSKSGNDITISSTGGGGGGSSVAVIDNLNSSSAISALSANQGRVLDGKITDVADTVDTNSDDIDSLESDVTTLQTNVTNMTADIASLAGSLDDKLDASNILAGTNITIDTDANNNVTISSSGSSVSKYSLTELKALTDPTDDLFLSLKADIINHNPMVITYNKNLNSSTSISAEAVVLSATVETVQNFGEVYIISFRKDIIMHPGIIHTIGFVPQGEQLVVSEILMIENEVVIESVSYTDSLTLDSLEPGDIKGFVSNMKIRYSESDEWSILEGVNDGDIFIKNAPQGSSDPVGYLTTKTRDNWYMVYAAVYHNSSGFFVSELTNNGSNPINPIYYAVKNSVRKDRLMEGANVSIEGGESGWLTISANKNESYGTCSSSGDASVKVVNIVRGYYLVKSTVGNILRVRFDNALTCDNPTLRVGYRTSFDIYDRDTNNKLLSGAWGAGDIVTFYWDGSVVRAIAGLRATTNNYGEAKLSSSVSSTSTTEAATSSAVREAYNLANSKQDALVSGTNIKTINGTSILGSGNINISGSGGSVAVDSALSSTSENPVQNKVINSALNNKANSSDIPTKVSDLTNDSGFISSYTETDPVFSASAAHGITSSDISSWNNKSDFSGSYTDLTDKPTIPSKTSDLTNDSDFITKTSYASNQNGGVIKTDTSTYGTSMYSGYLTGSTRTYSQYNSAANALFVSKGTLENVITGKGLATSSDIPTKVSDLTNDSGFISSYTETDPVFSASAAANISSTDISNWNSKTSFSGDYDDLTNKPSIPTKVSDLTNDSGFISSYTETDPIFSASAASGITSSDISSWNNKSTFSGDYDDLTNKPTIPTATSDLTNDSGFITSSYHDSSKQDVLVSGTNIKTINGNSILGNGDISLAGGETLKVGTILPFSGSTLPTGYLFCDGSAVSRTTYAGLFDVIGTTFGSGDGSTTFNLPNLKGKVPVGLDSNDTDFDTLGETGGEKKHTLTQSELPNYNLKGLKWANSGAAITLDSGSHTPGYNLNYGYNGVNEGQIDNIIINSGGSNTPHSNLQPYIVVNYIIKASQTTPVQAQIVDSYSESTTDGYSANYINQINSGKTDILLPAISANNSDAETSITSYTIPEDGLYLITGYGQPNLYGASSRDLAFWIRKNNSAAIIYMPFVINQNAYTVSVSFSAVSSFAKNDVINFNIKSSTTSIWAFNGGKVQIVRLR